MGRPCGILVLVSTFAMGSFALGTEVGNIHFGQLYVHPRIGVEATYDDNVFLLGEKKVDDVLFTIRPGVDLDFTHEGKSARVNYLAEIGRFVDTTDYDYENHLLNGSVNLQFPSGLMFFVGDVFRKTVDRLTYEFVPLVKKTQNVSDVRVGYEFTERLSVQAAYGHLILDYKDPIYEVYDRDDDTVEGTVFYRIFSRVSLLGQYQFKWINYDRETGVRFDADGMSAFLGVTGQITPKLVVLAKGGYQQRDYDGPRDDYNGGAFSLDVVHRCTDTLTLTAGGTREAVESTYSTNNFYTTTEARAGLDKQLGAKWTVGVSGFYANSDYPEATFDGVGFTERDDDIWGGRVGLRYQIQKWLTTSLWYTHEERNSNQDPYDYDDNRVSLGVSAVF